jgi:hypothetical protein
MNAPPPRSTSMSKPRPRFRREPCREAPWLLPPCDDRWRFTALNGYSVESESPVNCTGSILRHREIACHGSNVLEEKRCRTAIAAGAKTGRRV